MSALLLGKFAAPKEMAAKRRRMQQNLKKRYGQLSHPGDWIDWVVENAPASLRQEVAQLDACGWVGPAMLNQLVVFHDRTRLYEGGALLDPWEEIAKLLGLGETITIEGARRILRRLGNSPLGRRLVRLEADRCVEAFLDPDTAANEYWSTAWRRASSQGRRTAAALARLEERCGSGARLCELRLAQKWPTATSGQPPFLCWNPIRGVGLVDYFADDEGPGGATIDLYVTGERLEDVRLKYWYLVESAPPEAVDAIERRAFGNPVLLEEGLAT